MSQSETEPENEVETCQVAMEAALEKGIGFCDSEESRREVLSQNVGLNGSERDFSFSDVLDKGPGATSASIQTRQWVVARASELIDTKFEDSPLDAINEAWTEAADQMTEQGPDHDGDDDDEPEPEADDEDE